jgi:O-succinylbenzoate synthase
MFPLLSSQPSDIAMKFTEYKLPLKNGSYREGIIVQNGDCFGDIAPLPGFSRETLAEAKQDALHAIQMGSEPTLPSVRFAFACAHTPLPNAIAIPIAGLDRTTGFQAVKCKLGELSLEDALIKIKQIPKHLEIRLDFNQQWPLRKLLAFAAHFTPETFAYFEEPTRDFRDLLLFSQQTKMPIAVDESIPFVPYWDIPTLKAVIVKPTILGAVPFIPPGAECIFSSAYESGIGVLHIARLAQEHNPTRPHGLDSYSQFLEDVIAPRPVIKEGYLSWKQ